jgi:hypothetical protein
LPLPDKPSIAVLPFQNLTGDAEQEYQRLTERRILADHPSRIRPLLEKVAQDTGLPGALFYVDEPATRPSIKG